MFGLSCAPQLRAYQHLCMQSSTSIYICANKIILPTKLSCVCFRGTKSEFGIYFQLGCPSSEWLMVSCPSLRSTESQLNFVLDEQPCWLMNYFNMLLSKKKFILVLCCIFLCMRGYWPAVLFFNFHLRKKLFVCYILFEPAIQLSNKCSIKPAGCLSNISLLVALYIQYGNLIRFQYIASETQQPV